MITTTTLQNTTLHWAYLEFAMRASASKPSGTKPPSIPVSRNIIEAIRYSYDFLDAATEFLYTIVRDGPDGDSRPDNWLTRYVDRSWNKLSLADKIGFLGFSRCSTGFWKTDAQLGLFEDLRTVRNALTHPGIFGIGTTERFRDHSTAAISSRRTARGKMKRSRKPSAAFPEHPADLDRQDANKAVEIAVRHAERFEELFSPPGATYFSRINPRTGATQNPAQVLARMRSRHFDAIWLTS